MHELAPLIQIEVKYAKAGQYVVTFFTFNLWKMRYNDLIEGFKSVIIHQFVSCKNVFINQFSQKSKLSKLKLSVYF